MLASALSRACRRGHPIQAPKPSAAAVAARKVRRLTHQDGGRGTSRFSAAATLWTMRDKAPPNGQARGELLVAPGTPCCAAHAGASRRDHPNPTSRAAFGLAKIGTGRLPHRQHSRTLTRPARPPPQRLDNRGPLQIGATSASRPSWSGSGSNSRPARSGRSSRRRGSSRHRSGSSRAGPSSSGSRRRASSSATSSPSTPCS